jgi:hypothetical protein
VITGPLLVLDGADRRLPGQDHTRPAVFEAMLLQVMRDYASLGDWRDLDEDEIEWLYDALRPELRKATKPRG